MAKDDEHRPSRASNTADGGEQRPITDHWRKPEPSSVMLAAMGHGKAHPATGKKEDESSE